jgi:hypothetical protein
LPVRLGDHENVARYVGGSNFDPATGRVNGAAFDRTAKDVGGLSFNRTGVLSQIGADDDRQICLVMASRISFGKTAVFAETNVGESVDALRSFGEVFHFIDDPLKAEGTKLANPAHALMIGLPFVGEAIGSLKAELAGDLIARTVQRVFPAQS